MIFFLLNTLLFVQRLCAPEIITFLNNRQLMKKRASWLKLREDAHLKERVSNIVQKYSPDGLEKHINYEGTWLAHDKERNGYELHQARLRQKAFGHLPTNPNARESFSMDPQDELDPNAGAIEPSWPVAYNMHQTLFDMYLSYGYLATRLAGDIHRNRHQLPTSSVLNHSCPFPRPAHASSP